MSWGAAGESLTAGLKVMNDEREALLRKMQAEMTQAMGGRDAIVARLDALINDPRLLIPGPDAKTFTWKPVA